jgi:FMN phosphatase YigB (HAD superfamily)
MYNNKRGIIFDSVGVLLDDPLANLDWLAERYGADRGRLNQAKNKIWVREFSVDPDMTPYQFWSRVFEDAGVVIDRNDADGINKEIIERHYPRKEMLDYVRGLKGRPDVVTTLWTNVSRDWLQRFDEGLGLTGTFDYIAASCLERKRKEDPDFVRNTLRRMKEDGCGPIAGIDDQEGNLRALSGSGVDPTILYMKDDQAIAELDDFLGD